MPPKDDSGSGLSPEIARLSAELAKNPKSKLFIPLAEEYMKAGMTEEAVMVLEDGLKTHSAYMSARVLLGRAYLEKGDVEAACAQFETVVKTVPDNLYANRKLGDIYRSQGRAAEAVKAYEMVAVLSPKDEEVRRILDGLQGGTPETTHAPAAPEEAPAGSQPAEEEAPVMPRQARAEPPPHPDEPGEGPEEEPVPKVYDLSDMEIPGPTEDVQAAGPEPDYETPGQPLFMEMPVPEMDTLEQVRRAQPVEWPDAPLEGPEETLEWPEMPAAEGPEILAGERPFLDAAAPLEALEGPVGEGPKAAPGGYRVDLGDIFEQAEAAAGDEAPPPSSAPVYEIGGEPPEGGASGPVPEGAPEARKEGMQAGGAPSRDALETETLAELYISQGFYDRAIGIYKNLLIERPGDMALKQKLEDLYMLAGVSAAKSAPRPAPKEEAVEPYSPVDFDLASTEEAGLFETFSSPAKPPAAPPPQVDQEAVRRIEAFLENIRRKGGQ